jgi:hypothetical protein
MPTQHSQITDALGIHEPKGISTATAGEVYVADGAGSGSWQSIDAATPSYVDATGSGASTISSLTLNSSNRFTLSGGMNLTCTDVTTRLYRITLRARGNGGAEDFGEIEESRPINFSISRGGITLLSGQTGQGIGLDGGSFYGEASAFVQIANGDILVPAASAGGTSGSPAIPYFSVMLESIS